MTASVHYIFPRSEGGCRCSWPYPPSPWGGCAFPPLHFGLLPAGWAVNQISEISWGEPSIFGAGFPSQIPHLAYGTTQHRQWHQCNWDQWITAKGLETSSRERGRTCLSTTFIPDENTSWNDFLCPRCFRSKQLSSADSTYYTCAQDMNSWFSAMQYYFLPVHTLLAIIGALKSKASVFFSVLILFVSKYIVELTEMLVWLFKKKEALFHLLKSSIEAFIHLLFIQCSFLASFLLPATQCNIIMKAFKVTTTILRTHHFRKYLTIFLHVGKKGTEVCLNYEGHTHTPGKRHVISENYLIEPQLETVTHSCNTQSAYDAVSCSPPPHRFPARLLKRGSYRILNTMAKDMYLDVSTDVLVHQGFLCILHRGTEICFFRSRFR